MRTESFRPPGTECDKRFAAELNEVPASHRTVPADQELNAMQFGVGRSRAKNDKQKKTSGPVLHLGCHGTGKRNALDRFCLLPDEATRTKARLSHARIKGALVAAHILSEYVQISLLAK